jgi:hypothetical protein
VKDDFTAQLAATALVGFTGVSKAITQHPLAAIERTDAFWSIDSILNVQAKVYVQKRLAFEISSQL